MTAVLILMLAINLALSSVSLCRRPIVAGGFRAD